MKSKSLNKIISTLSAFTVIFSLIGSYTNASAVVTLSSANYDLAGGEISVSLTAEATDDFTTATIDGASDYTGDITLPAKDTTNNTYTFDITNASKKDVNTPNGSLVLVLSGSTTGLANETVTIPISYTPPVVATPTPPPAPILATPSATSTAYITNYAVLDIAGNSVSTVKPGDKVIISVTVIDERIDGDTFAGVAESTTNRIIPTMTQNSFTAPNGSAVDAKIKPSVPVTNETGTYNALCYTLTFRDVTYQGGANAFGFSTSYTGGTGNSTNNQPIAIPLTPLTTNITQATDNVPAPKVVLNSANYGSTAVVGQPFTLSTVATNISSNLSIENTTVQITLPQGIVLSSGNSQAVIGTVSPNGTINHNFNLTVQSIANDVKSLPVTLTYSYEAFVNGKRETYTAEQAVSINVTQETRFEISSIDTQIEVLMSDYGYISATLVNKGKTTVSNVQADIVSDLLMGQQTVFVGNVAPGESKYADFEFNFMQVGEVPTKLVITYEVDGVTQTIEREVKFNVAEDMSMGGFDDTMIAPPIDEVSTQTGGGSQTIIIAILAIGAVGGFIFYRKKKKAKRLLELEDEDENI